MDRSLTAEGRWGCRRTVGDEIDSATSAGELGGDGVEEGFSWKGEGGEEDDEDRTSWFLQRSSNRLSKALQHCSGQSLPPHARLPDHANGTIAHPSLFRTERHSTSAPPPKTSLRPASLPSLCPKPHHSSHLSSSHHSSRPLIPKCLSERERIGIRQYPHRCSQSR